MNIQDEELQKQVERGDIAHADGDVVAYQKVFEILEEEPDFVLPTRFSDQVITRFVQLKERKETKRAYLWLAIGLTTFLAATIFAVVETGFTMTPGIFKFVSNYSGLLIFAVAFILMLQWVDKRLVHPKHASS